MKKLGNIREKAECRNCIHFENDGFPVDKSWNEGDCCVTIDDEIVKLAVVRMNNKACEYFINYYLQVAYNE